MADYLLRFDIRTFLLCQATDSRQPPERSQDLRQEQSRLALTLNASGFAETDGSSPTALTTTLP